MFHVPSFMKNGFTLIELLIVIGIMAILTTIGSVYFFGYRNKQAVELTTNELISVLRDAQNKSLSQDRGYDWGVHFDNVANPKYYNLFFGAPSNIASHKVLRPGLNIIVNITSPTPPSDEDENIYFNSPGKVDGLPVVSDGDIITSATITINNPSNPSWNKIIAIQPNGQIQPQN